MKFKNMASRQNIKSSSLEKVVEENVNLSKAAIEKYQAMPLSLEDPPWIIFHAVLARGMNVPLRISSKVEKGTITLKEYLCSDSSEIEGWKNTLLDIGVINGRCSFHRGEVKHIYEDHLGQFLMILAMAGLTQNDSIFHESSGENIPLELLFNNLKSEVTMAHDASWLLCLLSLWEDGNSEWKNKYGQTLSLDILTKNHIEVNFKQSFNDSRMPCLGTHAVFGLVYALNHYKNNGLNEDTDKMGRDVMVGLYQKAEQYMNKDGKFSINWLEGMFFDDSNLPVDWQLNHQAHMLEWIIYGASDSQLQHQEWIHKAVNYYVQQLNQENMDDLSYGALSHGMHALKHYKKRLDEIYPGD